MDRKFIYVPLSILFVIHCFVGAVVFEDDVNLTKQQAAALQKFKTKVLPKLAYDYQKEDIFLSRYLRAKNFDVSKAEEFLLSQMKCRKENNMETIHQEDWTDMDEFTMKVEGHDRDGRPLIFMDMGDYNIRAAAVSGKIDRLVRKVFKTLDQGRIKVRELGLQGKNVTRWTLLFDLKNSNAITNVNPASIPFYIGAGLGYDLHFPKLGDRIFMINTPGLFESVIALIKPGLTQETRDSLKVYGKNEASWLPVLHDAIDPAMLPRRYGGNKDD